MTKRYRKVCSAGKSKPQGDITLDLVGWLLSKKQEQILANVSKNVERENPYMLLMGMEFGEATKQVENSMEVPQIIKNRTAMWACNSTPRYSSRETGIRISKPYLHSWQHYSWLPRHESSLNVHQLVNGWRKCGIYIHKNIIQPKKEGKSTICDNMGESEGHEVKWNKPNTEKQMQYEDSHRKGVEQWLPGTQQEQRGAGQRVQRSSYARWIHPRVLRTAQCP